MRGLSILGLLGLVCFATASDLRPRDYDAYDYYVLHLDSTAAPAQIARRLGLDYEGQLGELTDHHIFSAVKREGNIVRSAIKARGQLRKRGLGGADLLDGVKLAQKQRLKPRMEKRTIPDILESQAAGEVIARQDPPSNAEALQKQAKVAQVLGIFDPIFAEQWHLFNPVQVGHDVNVTDVWLQGITGHNATVAIVDDGLDMYSDDLKDNYYAEGSYDFNDQTLEPKPRLSDDRHGTRCAGEVSAVKNNVCGVGVAYDSKVAGIRILSKSITDADEAIAMNYAFQKNQIYSCSWGPPDDGRSMDAPGILIKRAMVNAVQNGRNGKGSIYVFASGNGAGSEDNCNFDGYTNSIYSITVGAVDRFGAHPYYSESCSANMVVTYSSGGGDAIHTTDVGTNTCASGHGGTSAAAPLAAGIFALVLGIRPDLTWRDLQYLAMQTAVPIDLDTGDWQTTSIGKKFSHMYGYGKIDSWAIVEAAKDHKLVKPQAWFWSPWIHVKKSIPQGDTGLAVTFEVTKDMMTEANVERLEHVQVTMNIEHSRRGDISVDLISPDNLVSHLSVTRKFDDSKDGYADWTFMSVLHWGESGAGNWTIVVKDTQVNDHSGTFIDWHLKLWGEAKDPTIAILIPLPEETDDDDHDEIAATTLAATTTSVAIPTGTTTIVANPTDHPDRPVNSKPAEPTGGETSPTSSSPASASTTVDKESSWLPSFFPTFGVSAKTQIWIYGAIGLIVVFCSGLGVYFYMARRKRLRNNPRDNYEFDIIAEEEAEGLTQGATGGRGKKGKRRAGELYDAFAAGSEDEDMDDFSEFERGSGEERAYRDKDRHSPDTEGRHVIGDDDEDEDEVEEENEKAER